MASSREHTRIPCLSECLHFAPFQAVLCLLILSQNKLLKPGVRQTWARTLLPVWCWTTDLTFLSRKPRSPLFLPPAPSYPIVSPVGTSSHQYWTKRCKLEPKSSLAGLCQIWLQGWSAPRKGHFLYFKGHVLAEALLVTLAIIDSFLSFNLTSVHQHVQKNLLKPSDHVAALPRTFQRFPLAPRVDSYLSTAALEARDLLPPPLTSHSPTSGPLYLLVPLSINSHWLPLFQVSA